MARWPWMPERRRAMQWRPNSSSCPEPKPANPLLAGPILPTLLRLTLPNLAAMLVMALVAIAETVLRRHPRHDAAGGHRPGVPHGHADADAVGRRHGGRRLLRHQPRARRRRRGPRPVPGAARHRHRRRGRIGVLRPVRRLRARHISGARRPRPRARARAHLLERGAGGRGADLAPQHAGLHRARHRQHARAVADDPRSRRAADRARRRAGARASDRSRASASPASPAAW